LFKTKYYTSKRYCILNTEAKQSDFYQGYIRVNYGFIFACPDIKKLMALRNNDIAEIREIEMVKSMQEHFHDPGKSLDPLLDRIGDARIVLLGEATHGTHEYYIWRAMISRRLIKEKGFNIVGVEGDWPDCYRINRYIRNYSTGEENSREVLKKFKRWPSWMWANWEISAFMEWLKSNNKGLPFNRQAGFYGLDVYSLWESLEAIIDYLRKNDPSALKTAQKAMQCFEPYDREGQDYAASARLAPEACEKEVLDLLKTIRKRVPLYDSDPEAPFSTEQNAMTAVNAEKYYRSMIRGGPDSWNIRDEHMTGTLERLLDFHGPGSKAIVWEHNTHIGDARATNMADAGIFNVGQLVRERWDPSSSVSVGFGSYKGSVIAGSAWGAEMQEMHIPAARRGSWEALLHSTEPKNKLIITEDIKDYPLMARRLSHRAIGVVYDPEMESFGNYVPSLIPRRYDAFMFLDESRALYPLKTEEDTELTPETYPFGL